MIAIKSPERYIHQGDILQSGGEYIIQLGSHALIIGGKTAVSAAGGDLFPSLDTAGVTYEVKEFNGHVTVDAIKRFHALADEVGANLIIGIGGGRVLDLSKAVGNEKHIPVVAVPTVAATCAAWSALSIIYDSSGKFAGGILLDSSPKLVLADTKILAAAPLKYLVSGIGDTLAKWYEAAPSVRRGESEISLQLGLSTAKLALDLLNDHALEVIHEIETGKISPRFNAVVDAIILLAGFVGGVNGGSHRAAIGHAIYNALTAFPEAGMRLHGEKVSFGLIVQFILEGKPINEVRENILFFNALGLPVTLFQVGLKNDVLNKISQISKEINISDEALRKLNFKVDSNAIEQAIIAADVLGREVVKHLENSGKTA
jgi:glycerol dehydrogenase-like iron-containing ADH family enzyme